MYALMSGRVSNIRESRRNGSCPATVTGNEICIMPLESRLNGFSGKAQKVDRPGSQETCLNTNLLILISEGKEENVNETGIYYVDDDDYFSA